MPALFYFCEFEVGRNFKIRVEEFKWLMLKS